MTKYIDFVLRQMIAKDTLKINDKRQISQYFYIIFNLLYIQRLKYMQYMAVYYDIIIL